MGNWRRWSIWRGGSSRRTWSNQKTSNRIPRFDARRQVSSRDFEVQGRATTFFFTNFPESWSEAELWKEFKSHGTLVDLYIARKVNKKGRKFGFIRYIKVKNSAELESRLNGLHVGKFKVKVNIAQFDRKKAVRHNSIEDSHSGRNHNSMVRKGLSYADVLRSSNQRNSDASSDVIKLSPEIPIKDWLIQNLIGKVSSFNLLHNLPSILEADGCADLEIRYIGGLSVLLKFNSHEEAVQFLENAKEVWGNWFSDLKTWNPEDVHNERLASLIIVGLPPLAWTTNAFNEIVKSIGEVVIPEECASDNLNMSVGRVGVLTKNIEIINTIKDVKVADKVFKVRITEDQMESLRLAPVFTPSFLSENDNISEGSFNSEGIVHSGSEDDDGEYVSETRLDSPNTSAPSRLVNSGKCSGKEKDQSPMVILENEKSQSCDLEKTVSLESSNKNKISNYQDKHAECTVGDDPQEKEKEVAINNSPIRVLKRGELLGLDNTSIEGPGNEFICKAQSSKTVYNSSLDLNKPSCHESMSKIVPASEVNISNGSQDISKVQSNSTSTNSEMADNINLEIQNTKEVGKITGFDMEAYTEEIRALIASKRRKSKKT